MTHPLENNCTTCGACAGTHCMGRKGPRKSFHRARGERSRLSVKTKAPLQTDSPIERKLVNAIWEWVNAHDAPIIDITTQSNFGPYRADILIINGNRKLVVECDGKEFHNTAKMIEKDKRRDGYCAIQGWAVMRFTGSEIHRDVRGCAAEVGAWIRLRV